MKFSFLILWLFAFCGLQAQGPADAWMNGQLASVEWKTTYKGMLADFHPVTITLASDLKQVAGYLIHDGDQRIHRLSGDWDTGKRFQLQERDENDRLTGYLSGVASEDQLLMDWMSADQSRMFQVRAFPTSLIRIKNFKPTAEWVEISSSPRITLSVQKMDFGIVSGLAMREGGFCRFEGYCLDGSCSIWNTIIQNPSGAPIRAQMRQRDAGSYKVVLDGVEYTGTISRSVPLTTRKFDNSTGFLDFVYPELNSPSFKTWMDGWVEPIWSHGIDFLTSVNQPEQGGRLVYRSSGWIEMVDENESCASGLVTFINPGSTKRIPFVWLKKEDIILSMEECVNTPDDISKASRLALQTIPGADEDGYHAWLNKTGYPFLLPTSKGVVVATEFNMIYGDDLRLIPAATSRELIKRKYWKYFGW